ncbi:3-deoxy-8-phosphooctulonate synthase [Halobacteriovorax sp. HLS]|uniref:3-deoxy-8-phosphooctulonate synthase n=1 Tax=Halobacteriovorax sp. HLS TaxID=2234000 RepID=UPI000FDBC264|nr:3-deoxy-8-phosphooctulonate synthase [Halobacteriovorax sp. HLS]
MKTIIVGDDKVKKVEVGENLPLALIAGPCAIETRDHTMKMADMLHNLCEQLNIPLIFKACYDKDCRSSIKSFHGVGLDEGLKILQEVRESFEIPVTADVSDASWANATGEVVDLVQIPAYLCRQTTLLTACGQTGKALNLKKGQYMSPWNMRNSASKIIDATGNDQIILTDRGTFFGYNMLVNDFRGLPIMKETGFPVCYDATHSIQMPTSQGSISGGQREFIPALVRSAVANGINALFMEVHDDPDNAKSDPATQIDFKYVERILRQAKAIHELRSELFEKYGEDDVK